MDITKFKINKNRGGGLITTFVLVALIVGFLFYFREDIRNIVDSNAFQSFWARFVAFMRAVASALRQFWQAIWSYLLDLDI